MVLDLISAGYTVAGAATGTNLVPFTGDSLQIRNGEFSAPGKAKRILGLAAWTNASLAGNTSIIWPGGADQVRGFNYVNVAADPRNKVGAGGSLRFLPQAPITIVQTGSVTNGQTESAHILNWYEDLPGTAGRLISYTELMERGVQAVTIRDSSTPAAAITYGGSRALNAASDLLLPDTDYAVVGYSTAVICSALCIQGVDNGGLRYGGPGMLDSNITCEFFSMLSMKNQNLPCIPLLSRANVAGTFVTVVENATTAIPWALHLVQLDRRSKTPIPDATAAQGPTVVPPTP